MRFVLALQLGIPVGELVDRMSYAEEVTWMALYSLDPWGDQRADARSALIAQLLHNTHAKKPKTLIDFMLFRDQPHKTGDSQQTIRQNFERLIAAQKRKRKG